MARRVDAAEARLCAVFVEDTRIVSNLEIVAVPAEAPLPYGADTVGAAVSMAGVVDAGASAALKIEDANRLDVGASAGEADVTRIALGVVGASALAIGAGRLFGNANSSIVAGESWAELNTVFVFYACARVDTYTKRTFSGDVAVALGAVFVGETRLRTYIFIGDTGIALVANEPWRAGGIPITEPCGVTYPIIAEVAGVTFGVGGAIIGTCPTTPWWFILLGVQPNWTS